jgi:5-methyltetrahydropteroyltriglutamate--homocysteine methyltransferase
MTRLIASQEESGRDVPVPGVFRRNDMSCGEHPAGFAHPNEIGPGVFDIHSPRVLDVEEMVRLLRIARDRIPPDRLWVNPDCGLKTRRSEEVRPALANMAAAAQRLRAELGVA